MSGKLFLFIGPMMSGKTRKLIREYSRLNVPGWKRFAFKPQEDTRFGRWVIRSRDGLEIPCVPFSRPDQMVDSVFSACGTTKMPTLSEVAVFVDEVQFADPSGIREALENLCNAGCIVFVAGLSGDRNMKPWDAVSSIIPIADTISYFQARCAVCDDPASFTAMVRGENGTTATAGQIAIESSGTIEYAPKCRKHWLATDECQK